MSDRGVPPSREPRPFRSIPPGRPYGGTPRNGIGNASLVVGILQFFCLPLIGAILAVAFGKAGIDRAKRGEATNLGVAQAGFWLGWAGLVFFIGSVALGVGIVTFAPQIGGAMMDPAVNTRTGLADGTYVMYPSQWMYLGGHCSGDGPVVGIGSRELVASDVTIVGESNVQCGGLAHPSQVMFTVTAGVATINTVTR